MTEKEKLIELIKTGNKLITEKIRAEIKDCLEKKHNYNFREDNALSMQEALADYLLLHGVVVPPCKVGDTVYTIYSDDDNGDFIEEPVVVEVSTHRIWIENYFFDYDDIGNTVFLTREQAEQALDWSE